MTGRPAMPRSPSAASLTSPMTSFKLDAPASTSEPVAEGMEEPGLLHQVLQWLQEERRKHSEKHEQSGSLNPDASTKHDDEGRTKSDRDLSLDRLERILSKFATGSLSSSSAHRNRSPSHNRRGSAARKLLKPAAHSAGNSDTDIGDSIATVPHVEASLDNTKTLSFSGGASIESHPNGDASDQKERKNWETFKQDILRLTHTLGLRGWRRLPLEHGATICVERLSGALTNAVYVVKPPDDMSLFKKKIAAADGTEIPMRRNPKDLLLRVYGPQTDHLVDRDSELMILRRLAAKNIGPKLLGYFTNGRFEEFLHAKTLTAQDLRDKDTSKQIAKRMKEMHEGIDLLESEKAEGPRVFKNWDSWVDRVDKVMTWLDQQFHNEAKGQSPASARYTRRGLVCGVDWKFFREAYDKYRAKLIEEYGGKYEIRKRLVFAHNDTQYGNLMKLQPSDESPLLQPLNQHKQLVVIDFEYASANTRGLEFANHFTEWCYDYHRTDSYACDSKRYPTLEEQHRFIRAYVMHRPQFAPSASSTPLFEGRDKTNIPDFVLDARAPGGGYGLDYDAEEHAREKVQEQEIEELLHETRLWRIANHALWVAWGIVQAKVPELDDPPKKSKARAIIEKAKHVLHAASDPLDGEVEELKAEAKEDRPESWQQEEAHHEGSDNEDDEEHFDYLAYSQDRAMFFWGDCILLGIVKESDLPEAVRPHIKYVNY